MDMKVTYKIIPTTHQVILSKVLSQSSNKADATEQLQEMINGKFEIVEIEELGEHGTYDYRKECRSLQEKEAA